MTSLGVQFPAPRHHVRRTACAFTLIEILIVVAIIVILAGIILAIGSGVLGGSKDRATKATFTTLDNAMSLFLKDHPEPAAGPTAFVAALQALPETSKIVSGMVSGGNILDGWGQPIQYVPATATAKKVGFFQSAGRNGNFGDSDDLFSTGTSAAP